MIKQYSYKIVEYDMQISALEKILNTRRNEGWVPISVTHTSNGSFLVTYETWWKVKK